MSVPFAYVRAQGSYREIGRQIGEAARPQIEAAISYYREGFERLAGIAFDEAEGRAEAYLAHARRRLPQLVEELEGMAEGSGQTLIALMVPNCGEEFTDAEASGAAPDGERPRPRSCDRPANDHCTAVAVAAGGRHVIGHNMDWYVVDIDKNVVFDVTVPDGTRFLSIAGVPYLPMLGLNSHGIGNVSNSVYSTDNKIGIPNAFVRRWSLEAPTLEEARARGLVAERARGTNHFLADTGGRLWDMETSGETSALMDFSERGYMAHTNHYASPQMAPVEGSDYQESRTRLTRAETLLDRGLARGEDPVELVAGVLRDHEFGLDAGICGHVPPDDPDPEIGVTVASMVCDLDNRRLYACAGPPCENGYRVFGMEMD